MLVSIKDDYAVAFKMLMMAKKTPFCINFII